MNETHRILCIEDDARERAVLTNILTGSSYEVWGAASGREGLELAAKQPDLIILDVGLPDIDGFEVCRRIKANADTRHIPVLLLSGQFTEDDDRAAGLDGGADAYLVKATANKVLMATVRSLLRMRDADRATGTPRTPIIAVTAQTDEASRNRCSAADMDGHVPKPIDREVLATAIREHVRAAGPPVAAESPAPSAAPAGANETAVLDVAGLQDRLGGDREAVRDILQVFLTDVQADVDLLDRGTRERNAEQVARQAHSLKGASANVGAETMRHAATALEAAGKKEDWGAIPSLMEALKSALAAALDAIREETGRLTDEFGNAMETERMAGNAGHKRAAAPRQTTTGPVRAIICDDSVAMRHSLMRVLDGYPVEVVGQAGNPDEAFRLADKFSPELVFLDVVMPGGSGIDVLRRLRDLPHPPLVVMLSSVAERETVIECRRLGAADYLLKPFDAATLKACIERVHVKLRGE